MLHTSDRYGCPTISVPSSSDALGYQGEGVDHFWRVLAWVLAIGLRRGTFKEKSSLFSNVHAARLFLLLETPSSEPFRAIDPSGGVLSRRSLVCSAMFMLPDCFSSLKHPRIWPPDHGLGFGHLTGGNPLPLIRDPF